MALDVDTGTYAIVLALFAGTLRALILWRASSGVEVVNVAVLAAIAEGRGARLDELLRGSGSGLYLEVAGALGRAALALEASPSAEHDARRQLEHAGRAALQQAGQALRRHAWLDLVALLAVAYAGVDALTGAGASSFKAVALVAATLLWLANVRTARHIATRAYAGADALLDGLLALRSR